MSCSAARAVGDKGASDTGRCGPFRLVVGIVNFTADFSHIRLRGLDVGKFPVAGSSMRVVGPGLRQDDIGGWSDGRRP